MTGSTDYAAMFGPEVLTLRIELHDIEPTVWREVVLHEDTPLPLVARTIEAAMGWLPPPCVPGRSHRVRPDRSGQRSGIDEDGIPLGAIAQAGTSFEYDYDFGDGWCHTVQVVEVEPVAAVGDTPVVRTGERACPPEDCGGPWGYGELIEALADPSHESHAELTGWHPEGIDPDHFDVGEANRRLPRGDSTERPLRRTIDHRTAVLRLVRSCEAVGYSSYSSRM